MAALATSSDVTTVTSDLYNADHCTIYAWGEHSNMLHSTAVTYPKELLMVLVA
jgi:hypothetical protein